jgi:cellulose synthase/poly-beta-1,6-N-acetylglucosamine synthase-like glycosyltransferase
MFRTNVKISIVVPAYNEEKLLPASLAQINASRQVFKEWGWESELIVCDNNSNDGTADVARNHGARVVFEPVNQIARARNAGAAAASGDWLIFVDADSHPSRSLFAETAALMTTGSYVGGGALVRLDESKLVWSVFVRGWNFVSRTLSWAAGSYVFCERAAFEKVGGFNTALYASEELDLSQRLKALARQTQRQFRIITNEAILTSARKMHLYSRGEHVRFLLKVALRPKAVLARREECFTWYDGRR